jgi:hypothetical protein
MLTGSATSVRYKGRRACVLVSPGCTVDTRPTSEDSDELGVTVETPRAAVSGIDPSGRAASR